jgi:hypothetical protein
MRHLPGQQTEWMPSHIQQGVQLLGQDWVLSQSHQSTATTGRNIKHDPPTIPEWSTAFVGEHISKNVLEKQGDADMTGVVSVQPGKRLHQCNPGHSSATTMHVHTQDRSTPFICGGARNWCTKYKDLSYMCATMRTGHAKQMLWESRRGPSSPLNWRCLFLSGILWLVCLFVCLFVCFETGSYYVAEAGLQLEILLPQPPKFWDHKCALPHLLSPSHSCTMW